MYQIKLQLINKFGLGGKGFEFGIERRIVLDGEDRGVGEENLGWKVEEPTDEIGGIIEEGWQDVYAGKIGDEDGKVAADEEDETQKITDAGAAYFWGFAFEPFGSEGEVQNECTSIGETGADYEWDLIEANKSKEEDEKEGPGDEEKWTEVGVASGVEILSETEEDDASSGDIIDGQDDVGEKSEEEGAFQQVVLGGEEAGIDKTGEDGGDFNDGCGEEEGLRDEFRAKEKMKQANNEEIDKHQRPESNPEAEAGEDTAQERGVNGAIHEQIKYN